MKTRLLPPALALALATVAAHTQAQVPVREATPQQQLATTCAYEAGVRELQGRDRTRFVAACLAEGQRRAQQVRAACMAEARGRTPQEWRAFMAECVRR